MSSPKLRILNLVFLCATLTSVGVVSRAQSAAPGVASSATPETQEAQVERERRRLEDLFISKMSEELKLPKEAAQAFTKALQSLNREKAKLTLEVSDSLVALEKAQSAARPQAKVATVRALKRYENAVKTYGTLPSREVSRLRKILGNDRLGRYLLAKSQMAETLKAMSARETAPSATLSPATP